MRKQFLVKLIAILALAAALTVPACKKGTPASKSPGKETGQPKKAQTVIATIGNNKDIVTWEEFNDMYHLDRMGRSLSAEQTQKLLDNLINQHLVYLDGMAKGYDKNPEVLEQMEKTQRQLILRYVLRDLSQQQTQVTDEDMRKFYDNNPDKFKTTLINYMFFNLRKYDGDSAKARDAADKALKALKSGEDMGKLNEQLLERKAPLTMTVRKDQKSFYGPDFDQNVWNTEEGQFGGISENPQGFIIFKVVKRETQTFEQAQPYIRNELTQGAGRNRVDTYYDELRKKYPVKVDQSVLDSHIPKNPTPQSPAPPGVMPGPGAPGMPGMPGMPPGGPGMMPGAPGMPPRGGPGMSPRGGPRGMPPRQPGMPGGQPGMPPAPPPPSNP